MPRNGVTLSRALIPAAVLIATALIYISPVIDNIHNIGTSDWDNQLFYHGVAVKTILSYKQFPLWNPFHCGGNTMLASPEVSFLSPPFVFALIFGEVVGLKLIIVFFTLTGFFGMYYLSRTLGIGWLSSFLPPAVFMMSSWYALRVTEGHAGFLPFSLLPFASAFYIKSIEERGEGGVGGAWGGWARGVRGALPMLILSSLFLTWMIFAGGVYPFTISVLFLSLYSLLSAVSRKSLAPVINLALIAALAFLFSAVKTVPQYEFIREFPRKTVTVEYHSAKILKDSLFKRGQKVTGQDPSFYQDPGESDEAYLREFWGGKRPWGWHEYGAFVGFAAFALYLAGFTRLRRTWVWIAISLLALILSMGDFSPVNLWWVLRRLPVFSSLHGPSRFSILFVFALSIVSAYALSSVEEGRVFFKDRLKAGILVIVILLAASLEMITVSRPVLKDAFTLPPYGLKENKDFVQLVVKDPTGANYPYFLKNIGVLNCYESQHPGGSVSPYGDDLGHVNPGYRGEAYLVGAGAASISYFSPNRVRVRVDPGEPSVLVLNQNYFKGWMAEVDGKSIKAGPYDGLVSVEVAPGVRDVIFYYSPLSFKLGILVTLVSLISAAVFTVVSRGREAP